MALLQTGFLGNTYIKIIQLHYDLIINKPVTQILNGIKIFVSNIFVAEYYICYKIFKVYKTNRNGKKEKSKFCKYIFFWT